MISAAAISVVSRKEAWMNDQNGNRTLNVVSIAFLAVAVVLTIGKILLWLEYVRNGWIVELSGWWIFGSSLCSVVLRLYSDTFIPEELEDDGRDSWAVTTFIMTCVIMLGSLFSTPFM